MADNRNQTHLMNGEEVILYDVQVDHIIESQFWKPKAHSFFAVNIGNVPAKIGNKLLSPGDSWGIAPPALNAICRTNFAITFDATGVLSPNPCIEITKTLIVHPCFEAQNNMI